MKRVLLVLLAVVVVAVAAVAGVFVSAFRGLRPASEAAFPDGARPVEDGYVSAFMIPVDDAGKKVVLIDCDNDPEAAALEKALAGKTVAAIFLTHGHADHVGGCAKLPGVPVYAMKAEIDAIEGRAKFQGPLPSLMGKKDSGVKVTNPLDDGAVIDVDGLPVHAFSMPGHTAGSAVYAVKTTLYFGDAAVAKKDGTLAGPPWVFSDDTALGRRSLAALPAKLAAAHLNHIETYAFAHSGSVAADPALLARFAQ